MNLDAVVEDPALVEAALESALRRDPEVLDRLIDRLDAVGGRGRRGAGVAREILAVRDPGSAPTESMFETLLDRLLRGAGLPIPVRQHEVKQGDIVLARLDFAWPELRVGLEAEGLRWHAGRQAFQRGVDRANDLALTRWTVIRVTWDDLVRRPDRVVVKLRQALGLT